MPKPRRPPLPAAPALVANRLAELAVQRAHATLAGRLAAIAQAHALLRLKFDARDPVLRRTLQGITRLPPRRAVAIRLADLSFSTHGFSDAAAPLSGDAAQRATCQCAASGLNARPRSTETRECGNTIIRLSVSTPR